MYRHVLHHAYPCCLDCHPHAYIRMVQNLIEWCLMFRMDRDECVETLARHARIRPPVTLAVWRELLKENKEFFDAYFTYDRSEATHLCDG
ncbi:hypothetical protein M569_15415 [Genlisea aurea]|uniref:Uncharacterized protein n=1 Tax=Genlisea aurea TaxID=192259 RepID=S8C4T4_9LAMI|nr:hypothetical protein M569_15415 [Genlisea aurea]